LVEDTGRVDADADRAGLTALEAEAQIDAAVLAEAHDRLAGRRVERVEPVLGAEVDAPLVAALPVHEAADSRPARGLRALERVEAPPVRAGGGVQREDAQLGRTLVEYAVGHH